MKLVKLSLLLASLSFCFAPAVMAEEDESAGDESSSDESASDDGSYGKKGKKGKKKAAGAMGATAPGAGAPK